MEVTPFRDFEVGEATQAGEARRGAMSMAREMGFDDVDAGRVGIVVTEAATNLVKHGRGGRVLVQPLGTAPSRGIGTLAIDRGPGMTNLSEMLRDGFSTSGTPGTGLGAIARQSDQFQIYSNGGKGTAVFAGIWPRREEARNGATPVGGVSVPLRGQDRCGDGWAATSLNGRTRVLVVDGTGHGLPAHQAASIALELFAKRPEVPLAELMQRLHAALRPTRGAAGLVVDLDAGRELVNCCGIGNIGGRIIGTEGERHVVSHFGTIGHEIRRVQEFEYPWPRGATLVLHSDGLGNHWKLDDYPGLAMRDPTLVAGVLFRDHARTRDDCTVVVARNP